MEVIDVVIIGAGIAGLATALALKRVGVQALVLEKSDELRAEGTALTLAPNAWRALDVLGVSHKLTSIYAPFKKVCVTNVATGTTQTLPFIATTDKKETTRSGLRSVHRKALHKALAEELPVGSIRFSSKFTAIETITHEESSIAVIYLEDGSTINAKVLIGCDGVHSNVARWLGLKEPASSGRWAVRGISVYPDGHGFSHQVEQFVDVGKRAGLVPLTNKEVYWFMSYQLQSKGEDAYGNPKLIKKKVLEDLAKDFPSTYKDVVCHSDLSTLSTAPLVFRYPWDLIFGNLSKQNIALAGDAMHPMTPDLGQGACAALEDAVVLGRHIGNSFVQHGRLVSKDIPRALNMYVKERRWRAIILITCAYLSGQLQQDGSNWFMKFVRDDILYKLLFPKIRSIGNYDCGKLPTPLSQTYN